MGARSNAEAVMLLAYAFAHKMPILEPHKLTRQEKEALQDKWREINASPTKQ